MRFTITTDDDNDDDAAALTNLNKSMACGNVRKMRKKARKNVMFATCIVFINNFDEKVERKSCLVVKQMTNLLKSLSK